MLQGRAVPRGFRTRCSFWPKSSFPTYLLGTFPHILLSSFRYHLCNELLSRLHPPLSTPPSFHRAPSPTCFTRVSRMEGSRDFPGGASAGDIRHLRSGVLHKTLGREDPLEKAMATHSSIPARTPPWTEEPGGLQSMGSQRVQEA